VEHSLSCFRHVASTPFNRPFDGAPWRFPNRGFPGIVAWIMVVKLAPAVSSHARFPAWQSAYEAVLRATDTNSLFKLVEIAEPAILIRRDRVNGKLQHKTEQRAIRTALGVLAGIKKEKLRFCA
jgi:hypothetical protein